MLHVAPILYRNSVLPAIRSEFFNTIYDNQHAVHVVVVQGEGKTVGENRLIGSFLFELEQPCPKGTRCEIQLTYDVNGMVQVFAKQFGTKNEVKAQFDSRTGEVTGWTVIQKQNSPSSIVLTSTQTTADVETQEQANILSFPTAKKYKTSSDASEKEVAFSGGIVINALFLRVKKYLSQLDKTSAQFIKISEVLFSYTKLLQQAQEGAENDDELEIVENNLLDLLERKD
jgi:molecular chaperone DnaK (HSP70)